eukprot:scaffold83806_cov23-Prasinocladus_malaysianus.AAC.1
MTPSTAISSPCRNKTVPKICCVEYISSALFSLCAVSALTGSHTLGKDRFTLGAGADSSTRDPSEAACLPQPRREELLSNLALAIENKLCGFAVPLEHVCSTCQRRHVGTGWHAGYFPETNSR